MQAVEGEMMHRLATLDDLTELEPRQVTVGGRDLAVVRIGDDVYAFAATCTHRLAPLAEGAVTRKERIVCPWHVGIFNLRDGAVVGGPPESALSVYPVKVIDGEVYLAVDES
jgi:nitrite reductase/ring-hydroxylating ferredoxin subunit